MLTRAFRLRSGGIGKLYPWRYIGAMFICFSLERSIYVEMSVVVEKIVFHHVCKTAFSVLTRAFRLRSGGIGRLYPWRYIHWGNVHSFLSVEKVDLGLEVFIVDEKTVGVCCFVTSTKQRLCAHPYSLTQKWRNW